MSRLDFKPSEFTCTKESFLAAEKYITQEENFPIASNINTIIKGVRFLCNELGIDTISDNLLKDLYITLKNSNNFQYIGIANRVNEIVGFEEERINSIFDLSGFLRENITNILDIWTENKQLLEIFKIKNINIEIFKKDFGINIINYFVTYIEGNGEVGDCPYVQILIKFFKDKNLTVEDVNIICNIFRFSVQDIINESYGEKIKFKTYREIDEIMLKNLNGVLTIFTIELIKLKIILEEAIKETAIVQTIDLNGNITDVNKYCELINGYNKEELIGVHTKIFNSGIHEKDFYADLWTTIKGGEIWKGIVYNKRKDGSIFCVRKTIIPIKDINGNLVEYIDIGFDITEEEKKATIDYLTGIYNREKFFEIFEDEINRTERSNSKNTLSLLFIDIDYFKKINDNYGHDAGDIVLKKVCNEIGLNIRKIDILSRLSGEELTIILPGTDKEGASYFAEKIRQIIEKLKIDTDKGELNITVSIGISEYISGDTTKTLLQRADQAMYNAKDNGRNTICIIDERIKKID